MNYFDLLIRSKNLQRYRLIFLPLEFNKAAYDLFLI